MVKVSTDFSVFSYLDVSQFQPFRIFNSYYVHYSTWLGAIWPMGVVTLLVIYGGSAIISFLDNPFTEDSSSSATKFLDANDDYVLPLTLGFVLLPAGNLTSGASQALNNESYVRATFELCTSFRNINYTAAAQIEQIKILGSDGFLEAKEFFDAYANTSSTSIVCNSLGTVDCRNGIGRCPLTQQTLQGSEANGAVRFLRGRLSKCDGSGPNNTNTYDVTKEEATPSDSCLNFTDVSTNTTEERCFRTVTCANDTDILAALSGATVVIPVGAENFPLKLLETDGELRRLQYNASYNFPIDTQFSTFPTVQLSAKRVTVLAEYFDKDTSYSYLSPSRVDVVYATFDSSNIMEAKFVLAPLERTTRFLPITAFTMVARFGQVIAAIAVANVIVRYINFLMFYSVADESYYVADIDTRKFLLSNRKAKVRDFENQLMFALTFGSVDRFGVQTRQLYEFFKDRGKRYDRKETQLIVEDIQKYRTAQRIGAFVKEEEKVGVGERNVEADYDLRKVTDRGAGRISRVRAAMTGKKLDFIEDEDVDGKGNMDAVIREVETTLKLAVIQDELNKMKVLAAMLFPEEAKKDRLAEKLNGTGKS